MSHEIDHGERAMRVMEASTDRVVFWVNATGDDIRQTVTQMRSQGQTDDEIAGMLGGPYFLALYRALR